MDVLTLVPISLFAHSTGTNSLPPSLARMPPMPGHHETDTGTCYHPLSSPFLPLTSHSLPTPVYSPKKLRYIRTK